MHKIPFSPPDITEAEIQEVCEALRSGWITTGPKTKEFERQIAAYCGTDKAVCLNSATACLEMTLRILGIGPGDEVITSALPTPPPPAPCAMWVPSWCWWTLCRGLMRWIRSSFLLHLQSAPRR